MALVAIPGAELDVFDRGSGEPVLLIQTALTADELRPLADEPALRTRHRTILYHRRGYGRSSLAEPPGVLVRDADDCRELLAALGIGRPHVIGVSFSAAIALQLAVDAPEWVRTLIVIDPPPLLGGHAAEFRAANERLADLRRTRGPAAALDDFLRGLMGPTWRTDVDDRLPGAVAQMERDAATFFDVDVPALLGWRFKAADAERITCPVLYVGGGASGPWFDAVREQLLAWLPHAEHLAIAGADHSLAVTHPASIAAAIAEFLERHASG